MLSVDNYDQFIKLVKKLMNNDIRISVFYEPDIEDQMTAIAVYCDGSLFKGMKLFSSDKYIICK